MENIHARCVRLFMHDFAQDLLPVRSFLFMQKLFYNFSAYTLTLGNQCNGKYTHPMYSSIHAWLYPRSFTSALFFIHAKIYLLSFTHTLSHLATRTNPLPIGQMAALCVSLTLVNICCTLIRMTHYLGREMIESMSVCFWGVVLCDVSLRACAWFSLRMSASVYFVIRILYVCIHVCVCVCARVACRMLVRKCD